MTTFISIHALREEGDPFRLPCAMSEVISIHALREEGDTSSTYQIPAPRHFYPRPPRGGRPARLLSQTRQRNFYPRPPRGGRPYITATPTTLSNISIHALREEGDSCPQTVCRR